jgi:hypothetical protein
MASCGLLTIGSFSLKDVLSNIGTLEIFKKDSINL